jgi:hypothetical protein
MTVSREIALRVANQVGATVLPDNKEWINRIEIRSESSDRLYTVAQRRSDGSWGCSCPGWKSHRHCKHLRWMTPLLAAPARPDRVR